MLVRRSAHYLTDQKLNSMVIEGFHRKDPPKTSFEDRPGLQLFLVITIRKDTNLVTYFERLSVSINSLNF